MSTWDRVEYLELDKPLEFFYLPSDWGGQPDPGIMMHETTHIVGATDAWDRVIVAPSGEILREVDLSFSEWDGDGTAIVDLDTGVDAGHPDYDYLEPWTGEKTLYSAKWTPADNEWVETRNSDTSSGHGTHVGGTIAGTAMPLQVVGPVSPRAGNSSPSERATEPRFLLVFRALNGPTLTPFPVRTPTTFAWCRILGAATVITTRRGRLLSSRTNSPTITA